MFHLLFSTEIDFFFYCRCTEARCRYLSVDSSLAYQDSHVLDVLKDLTHCLSRQRVPADL